MNFEDYLVAKKIDPARFSSAEPDLFNQWKHEFVEMHPNSFTMQKLNLINVVRRKYQHRPTAPGDPPVQARPIVKPKPKF